MYRFSALCLLFAVAAAACTSRKVETVEPAAPPSPESVPEWSQQAIWYQIFVERFHNGDTANDPTLQDVEGSWPHEKPADWKPAVWTSDFYAQADWEKNSGKDFYTTVQMRRYGGDFKGVIDKLDYLQDLGITAIYLNPVNDAPSLHKYDARNYHHMDRNFGPDPKGDTELMKQENPADPKTWVWTEADKQFVELVKEIHKRGMKVIVDFSWNHTGVRFWAWQDILKNGAQSPYKDWYEIEQFDDPATPQNEFKYRGWAGVPELPDLKKVGLPEGKRTGAIPGNLAEPVKQHVFDVTRRWMDPNGDGNPEDGIDGFRLDVAECIPLDFWREYRTHVRSINPEAYLVGEIWWEKWPDHMLDPKPWIEGDVFDAVMHYRWYKPTRAFLAQPEGALNAKQYVMHLDSVSQGIRSEVLRAMMNLTASHDTERSSSAFFNKNKYKYESKPNRVNNFTYAIGKPDTVAYKKLKLALVQQFTWTGAPHIWNGDEFGMWGADDPENRKPLWWPDMTFAPEATHPVKGKTRIADPVGADLELLGFYKQLIAMRRQLPALTAGATDIVVADPVTNLLIYKREDAIQTVFVVINNSGKDVAFDLEIDLQIPYHEALGKKRTFDTSSGKVPVALGPYEATVLYATEEHMNY
jgi:glycosidase